MNSHTHCNIGEEKSPDRTELSLLLAEVGPGSGKVNE